MVDNFTEETMGKWDIVNIYQWENMIYIYVYKYTLTDWKFLLIFVVIGITRKQCDGDNGDYSQTM